MQDLHFSISKTIKRTWSQQWRHQCFNGIRISQIGSKIGSNTPPGAVNSGRGMAAVFTLGGKARLTHWLPGKSAGRRATHCSFDENWPGPGQVCAKISHVSRILVKQALVQRERTENKRNAILSGLSLQWINPHILETSQLISPLFLGFSPHLFLGAFVGRSGWLTVYYPFPVLVALPDFAPYKIMGGWHLRSFFQQSPRWKEICFSAWAAHFWGPSVAQP